MKTAGATLWSTETSCEMKTAHCGVKGEVAH